MTCVVGIEGEGGVWLAGDSSCLDADGDGVITQRGSKVFRRGPYVIGFAGSFQVGDLLKHKVRFPRKANPDAHLIGESIRTTFREARLKDECWDALIGINGKLFIAQQDFYVYRHSRPYAAIGSASAVAAALGALRTLERQDKTMTSKGRLKFALEIAETFSSNVRRPWKYSRTPTKD